MCFFNIDTIGNSTVESLKHMFALFVFESLKQVRRQVLRGENSTMLKTHRKENVFLGKF